MKTPEPFGYFNNPALDGWQDCAETDEGARPLYDQDAIDLLANKLELISNQVFLARKTAQLMVTDVGHEVVCIDPERWLELCSVMRATKDSAA